MTIMKTLASNGGLAACALALTGMLACTVANAQSVSIAGYADPSCTSVVNAVGANGDQYLTFKPNGTWELGETEMGVGNVLDTGTWTSGTFNPSNYEIRAVGTFSYDHESGGGPSCQDPDNYYEDGFDSGWETLSSNFTIGVSAYTYKDVQCYWAQDINQFSGSIEIRQISNHTNASSTGVNLCVIGYAN
jgi:hypothetical protein